MVDKKYGIHEAFQKSSRRSRGSRLRILAVLYALSGVVILFALPSNFINGAEVLVFIGLLLYLPVRILSLVAMCRQLQGAHSGLGELGAPEERITNLVP